MSCVVPPGGFITLYDGRKAVVRDGKLVPVDELKPREKPDDGRPRPTEDV
jgi:hypothetical protein